MSALSNAMKRTALTLGLGAWLCASGAALAAADAPGKMGGEVNLEAAYDKAVELSGFDDRASMDLLGQVLAADPDNADALILSAWLQITSQDTELRQPREAVEQAKEVWNIAGRQANEEVFEGGITLDTKMLFIQAGATIAAAAVELGQVYPTDKNGQRQQIEEEIIEAGSHGQMMNSGDIAYGTGLAWGDWVQQVTGQLVEAAELERAGYLLLTTSAVQEAVEAENALRLRGMRLPGLPPPVNQGRRRR